MFAILIAVSIATVLFVKSRVKVRQQDNATQLLRMVVPDHVSQELAKHVTKMQDGEIVLQGNAKKKLFFEKKKQSKIKIKKR